MKSGLDFIGAPVPAVRKLAKELSKEFQRRDDRLLETLWSTGVWEIRGVAVALMELWAAQFTVADLPRFRERLIESAGWAHNDWMCATIAEVVSADPSGLSILDEWARDDCFWVRRAALLALMPPMARSDLSQWTRFEGYATGMLHEKEFFVRKAIGWVLREVSKKNPDVVRAFLADHPGASGVTLREATRYLDAGRR